MTIFYHQLALQELFIFQSFSLRKFFLLLFSFLNYDMARSIPPKPIPKPGHVKVVRALYKYTAQQPDELSFEEDDTLYILDTISDPNWWKAKCGQKVGLIPSNYVEDKMESIDFPLHEAAKRGNLNFLRECLQNKVSVNSLDKSGSTALHWASHAGHLESVLLLLEIPNIQLNVQNKLGDTALHSCSWKGHSEIAKALIEKGANCFITNKENQTPLQLARDPQVAALLQYACDNNPQPQDEYELSDSD